MKRNPHRVFGICYGLFLAAAFAAVLLDAFVIPREQRAAEPLMLPGTVNEESNVAAEGTNGTTQAAEQDGTGAAPKNSSDEQDKTAPLGNDEALSENGVASQTQTNKSNAETAAGNEADPQTRVNSPGNTDTSAENEAIVQSKANASDDADASESNTATEENESAESTESVNQPIVTATSYQDGRISVEIQTLRTLNTTYYAADIRLTDPTSLRTAFADNTYGRNIRQTTGEMAESVNAILAVNGDYYGFRDSGMVLRNGTLYRESSGSNEVLLIDWAGDFTAVSAQAAQGLDSADWWQGFSFGPALIQDGAVAVTPQQEVGQAKVSNPRTAIGQIDSLHYVFVVSDGRTDESTGFTLYQLAEVMQALGCQTAYNLDGGGSSTMVFMGEVVNQPTTNGRRITQREVSDIVYIGS